MMCDVFTKGLEGGSGAFKDVMSSKVILAVAFQFLTQLLPAITIGTCAEVVPGCCR